VEAVIYDYTDLVARLTSCAIFMWGKHSIDEYFSTDNDF